jgi:hypothetical protein
LGSRAFRRIALNTESLVLDVRYLGAKKHYVDPHASTAASLAQEKPKVLNFFSLKETPEKIYVFSQDGTPITNLSVTLGQLAQGKHELKLDLVEQLVQG